MNALSAVLPVLRCPSCQHRLQLAAGQASQQVRCEQGHSFDLARQGYLNLVTGRGGPGTGDTAGMVAARQRFLDAGHYLPIAAALAAVVHEFASAGTRARAAPVADCGGGTGYYLAQVLDELEGRPGICLDLSVPALRRAARAHPAMAAIGADAWAGLPLADSCVAAVLSVFAPRNPAEILRCLVPGGLLATVTPLPGHLSEAVEALGMIGIAPDKQERLAAQVTGFEPLGERVVGYQLRLLRDQLADLVLMGPSARHLTAAQLADRLGRLPEPALVTVAVQVSAYRAPAPAPAPAPASLPEPAGNAPGLHQVNENESR